MEVLVEVLCVVPYIFVEDYFILSFLMIIAFWVVEVFEDYVFLEIFNAPDFEASLVDGLVLLDGAAEQHQIIR